MKIRKESFFALIPVITMGCATGVAEWESIPVGGAARAMVEAQKLDPTASEDNAEKAATGTDGSRAEKVLAVYREGVVSKEDTDGDIVINVGN